MKKTNRIIALAMAAMTALSMTACSGSAKETTEAESAAETTAEAAEESSAEETKEASGETLLMATTTSTDNTGLLDYLKPIFLEDTGIDLQWTAVGTGDAIQKAKDGEVDVILVHSKAKEEEFVESGYGVERFQVMYNDFVIVGPKDGPIAKTDDINAAFKQIMDEQLTFVSRGDNSGTHNKETGIWEKLGITDYESNPNYVSAGAGMADTLAMADEKGGYCLSDRGTWLAKKADFPDMDIVCEGSKELLNQYGVIAVNPEKYPDVNNEAANTFIKWICSPEIQTLIGEYGVEEYGEPLFFLDYIACGKNDPALLEQVVSGVADGCVQSEAGLIGGETAEMPGMYDEDEYDLAGFAVGVAEKSAIVDGSGITAGDVLIGLPSTGVHSNGFSLVRKALFEQAGYTVDTVLPELGGAKLGDVLLTPTKIYVKTLKPLFKAGVVKGVAHITGGGFIENIPRMIPDGLAADITLGSWPVLPIFDILERAGDIDHKEMYNIFNMGIGMVLAVSAERADETLALLKDNGEAGYAIGTIVPDTDGTQITLK